MALERHTITTQYPCCDDNEEYGFGHNPRVRLALIDVVPCMAFERKCPSCGQKWVIEVKQAKVYGGVLEGAVIHVIEWEEER